MNGDVIEIGFDSIDHALQAQPKDLMRLGHMFPLRARPGGVLERRGHTEAAIDLARPAGSSADAGILTVFTFFRHQDEILRCS